MLFRALAILALTTLATAAAAQTSLRFLLDGEYAASSAGIVMADENGHFADADLSVEIQPTSGSRDAISRIAVNTYPAGLADINTLVSFTNDNTDAEVMAVMIVQDRPAYAIIGRSSLGIETPQDLEGRRLGTVYGDETDDRVPNFIVANLLDGEAIEIVDARDTGELIDMLADGTVDAIAAMAHTALPELDAQGVPADDLVTLRMAEHGLRHYGQAVVVNADFARAQSATVRRLIAAILAGWRDTVEDPEAAAQALAARAPALDPEVERERLEMLIRDNILTEWVAENGMGDLHYGRIEGAMAQLQEDPAYINPLEHFMFFDNSYLPSRSDRQLQ